MPQEPYKEATLRATVLWALKYLSVQALLVAAASLAVVYAGQPPWALLYASSWELTVARIVTWAHIASGLSDVVNGEASVNFPTLKKFLPCAISWTLAAAAQIVCLSLDSVPPVAALIVACATTVAQIIPHVLLTEPKEWPNKGVHAFNRSQTVFRWACQGLLVMLTFNVDTTLPIARLFGYVLGAQAVWQIYSWASSLESGLMHTFSLYINSLLLSHMVSIWATLASAQIGIIHLSIVVYALFAISIIIYEPRVSLPSRPEDTNMRIWARLMHPVTNPLYNTTPVLAMVSVTIRLALDNSPDTSMRTVALVCSHFLLWQALVFALRCWRYHVETCRRDLVLRATGRELVLDALIWGLLHAFILSSLPAASSLLA